MNTLIKYLTAGLAVSAAVCMIFIMLAALVLCMIDASDSIMLIVSLLAVCSGAFTGGFFTSKLRGEKGLISGALCGFMFFIILMVVSMLVNGNSVSVLTLIKLALCLLCSGTGGVVGVNFKRRKKLI